jgi:DNA segregation ATPase FtsK/SpoIIIE, S-DNA-T family
VRTGNVIIWYLVAALVVLLVAYAIPWVRANGETRRSMWQARLIRWRWARLARMLGLVVTDPTPTLLSALMGERDREVPPRIHIPRIRVRADEYGVVVKVRTLPRVGRDEWVRAAPHLANAWGSVRVAVTQDTPGRLVVRAVRRDPLTEPYVLVPTGQAPAELDRWEVGRDEYARPTDLRLSNVPGIGVAGLPGYGKTSLVNALIARLAPSPAVQLAVVDGKGGADYEDLTGRFFAWTGDDPRAANALFRRLYELRRQRAASIRSVLGVKNLWHVGPSTRWPLVLLVIDEAHTFFAEVKGDKDVIALTTENRRLVEDIVKKGRSVGICTLLATQKSTGDAIPTAIRDVCPVALSFAQRTDEAAVAALGGTSGSTRRPTRWRSRTRPTSGWRRWSCRAGRASSACGRRTSAMPGWRPSAPARPGSRATHSSCCRTRLAWRTSCPASTGPARRGAETGASGHGPTATRRTRRMRHDDR